MVSRRITKASTYSTICFGGGLITHASLLSGKYKSFIVNDIDARLPKLFLDSIHGKYTVKNHTDGLIGKHLMIKRLKMRT